MGARLEALTRRMSFSDAEAIVRGLAEANPGEPRLAVTAADMAYRQGDVERALAEMNVLAIEYPNNPAVHEFLAELLRVKRQDWDGVWEHYKVALRSGGLNSPCLREAAYAVGRSRDPSNADLALSGATRMERAVVRGRVRGPGLLFLVLDTLAFPAIALRELGHSGWGLFLMGLATAWAAWAIYGNDLVCCKKCRNAWIFTGGWTWFLFALTPHYFHGLYLVVLLVIAGSATLFMVWRDRTQLRKLAIRSS